MKKFFEEFKKFINRGNVIDLAVGVIIGGAFSKITSSLVNDIIMPLISAIFALFGVKGGVSGMSLVLNGVDKYVLDSSTNTQVLNPEAVLWNYGNFIQTVLDFLLIALVLFCIIKAINFANDEIKKAKKTSPFTKEELKALRKQGKSRKEIKALEAEKIAQLAEEARLAEEEAKANAPKTQEELLQEIVDMLAAKKAEDDIKAE